MTPLQRYTYEYCHYKKSHVAQVQERIGHGGHGHQVLGQHPTTTPTNWTTYRQRRRVHALHGISSSNFTLDMSYKGDYYAMLTLKRGRQKRRAPAMT